ncbi:hypothetical protein JRQ81_015867 [Phrynocephalus forsythii]|uniref:DUF3496 domain-containing protein n=1 Tax=Phrynocephalus forsythii TaxID=171643 RepID=A0A9Q0XUR6_9SAUR|nr:hypothetical protein JRQ81_015867 [Phrynocephalus forsythii]
MKKVKKIFRLGKTRKEQQQSLARSRIIDSVPALCTSSLDGGHDSYKMRRTDQGQMHQAAAEGNLRELRHLLKTHDLNEQDKVGSLQHLVEYSMQEGKAEDSSDDQIVLSVLSSPDRAGDTDVPLGAPVTDKEENEHTGSPGRATPMLKWSNDHSLLSSGHLKSQPVPSMAGSIHTMPDTPDGAGRTELLPSQGGSIGGAIHMAGISSPETCINEHSSGGTLRDSGRMGNDDWLSSEEEELDLNPKNPQKPCVTQLRNISQLLKKYFSEHENNQSLEENIDAGLQKSICPTKQEEYNSDYSSMDNKEAEFDEEGKKEEEQEKGGGNEEEGKEEEGDFSEEWGDEDKEESKGKVEHGEEEYIEKVGKRDTFTDNKCERGNDLSSSDKEACNASDEETQRARDMHMSFIARQHECSNENAVFNKVNDELSHDSFEKENSYKHGHQFQNTNGFQDTKNNNRIPHENQKGFHRNIISSVDTFEMTTLAGVALPSVVNSHDNKDMNSDWSDDSIENDYSQQSNTAWEIYKIIQQNSESPVDYQNAKEEQCMDTKELGEAIYEQLVFKNENNQEDAKLVPPEINEDSPEEAEKENPEDKKEEDGKNPDIVNINLISYESTQNQISTQDGGVIKDTLVLGMDEEEEKNKESPWTPEKREQNPPAQHSKMEDKMEHVLAEESQVTNPISSSGRERFLPIPQKGAVFSFYSRTNPTTSVTDKRKSKKKFEISTKRVHEQVNHQLQDDSSLGEAFPEEESVNCVRKRENKRQTSAGRVSQQITEKLHQLQEDSSLNETSSEEAKFSLKREEEKRVCAETLYEKAQKQLRRKEQQYCELMVEKQQLEFVLRSMKMELKIYQKQLQGSEEQHLQSERHIYNLRNAMDAKEQEASVISHQLQELLVKLSEAKSTIKQLEGHIQRLEIENGRLGATTNQQTNKIAALQNDLQESVSIHNQLEEVIAGLQTEIIRLKDQLNQQSQKQTALSVNAQDSHMWEEELKSQSKLRVHLSELNREKGELTTQFEKERKKVKKLVEFKRSIEMRLDQEMKRNIELQKKYNGIKALLKTTTKKLKEYESGASTSQTRFRGDRMDKHSKNGVEIGELRKKKSSVCPLPLEEDTSKQDNVIDLCQMQQYKKNIEEQAKQEVRQKLQEVNLFLQTQASSQEALEQIRSANNASLINQLESIVRGLEPELSKLKNQLQECVLQNESTPTELTKYKDLYLEELKRRKSLGSKLVWSNERLAEAKAKLFHERYKSKSLLASSFLSGSLSASPTLETGQLGKLGNNRASDRLCTPAGFRNPMGSPPLASKSRVEACLAEMQIELEKCIDKELDQANAELHARSGRVSPIGSFNGSSKNINM